jgi:large subunit ribosomal protein L9
MEVILKQDFKGLGYKNDLVKVKPGYGRNYLIPQGFAMIANEPNKKIAAENARQAAHKLAKRKQDAVAIAAQLDQIIVKIPAKAGEKGRIFGTVTPLQISDALKEKGVFIDRRDVKFEKPIKNIGTHHAIISLHKEVIHTFKFEVILETKD